MDFVQDFGRDFQGDTFLGGPWRIFLASFLLYYKKIHAMNLLFSFKKGLGGLWEGFLRILGEVWGRFRKGLGKFGRGWRGSELDFRSILRGLKGKNINKGTKS